MASGGRGTGIVPNITLTMDCPADPTFRVMKTPANRRQTQSGKGNDASLYTFAVGASEGAEPWFQIENLSAASLHGLYNACLKKLQAEKIDLETGRQLAGAR